MSNREFDQGTDSRDDAFAAVFRRWSDDTRLGPLLQAGDAAFLIFDEDAARVLYASPGAAILRSGIAGRDGRIDPALAIGAHVRRAGTGAERPALTRIQFDRRRIQPPVTCLVAPARSGDGVVIALLLTGRPPRLRPFADGAPPFDAVAPSVLPLPLAQVRPAEEELPPDTDRPVRFTWRSGGDDLIDAVAGPAGNVVRSAMAGRTWQDLAASRILTDAEGLLAALADHRTFRAISLVLRRPGAPPLELELSGAPLARAGQPFSGYGGFGLVRRMSAGDPGYDPPPVNDLQQPVLAEPASLSTGLPADPEIAPAQLPRRVSGQHLTGDEHDAFREIAKALGVRFAGDAPTQDEDTRSKSSGDVMPFPGPATRSPETAIPGPAEAGRPPAEAIALLEQLPVGILIVRDEGLSFANRFFLTLSRFDGIEEIAAAGGLGRLFNGLGSDELIRADHPVLLSRRDGGSLPVSVARAPVRWEGAPAVLMLVNEASSGSADADLAAAEVARDFATKRAAATAAILDSLEDGVLTLDADGRVLSLNRRAATMLALDPREVVGCGVTTLFAPSSAEAVLASLSAPASASGRPQIVDTRGGTSPALAMRLHPLDHGVGDGAVLVLSEARGMGEVGSADLLTSAEAASALRSEVLGKISHEIRTPLNGILGFTDAMLSEQFGPLENERYRECLRDIRASGEHVLNLVDDLVEIAGIEAGRRDLAFTEVPLNEIVSNCVALLQPQAARDRIVIRTSFSDNLNRLVADERSVRQAALNVIANALRFTEAGGQVIVSTTMADRGEIALRVRDTGSGMTPDEVEVALKPYSISAMNPVRGGTGLGLPLTKALVEANRGRFRIMSRKDEGTLVEMLFPTDEALSA